MANEGRGNSYSYLGEPGQPSSSAWLEKQQSANRKSKLMVRPLYFVRRGVGEWMSCWRAALALCQALRYVRDSCAEQAG